MRTVAALLLLAACGGSSSSSPAPGAPAQNEAPPTAVASTVPTCEEVVDRVMTLFPGPAEDRAEGIAECESKPWTESLRRCVVAVQDQDDLFACLRAEGGFEDEDPADATTAGAPNEAEHNLEALKKGAKAYYLGNAAFPVGTMPLTPAASCCAFDRGLCPPDDRQWDVAAWPDLNFLISDAHRFRYSYQSDGNTFVATALGDADCDGVEVGYTLEGRTVNGTLQITLTKPTHED